MSNIAMVGLLLVWPFSMFTSSSDSKHVQLADAVALPYCKQLKKEKQLQLVGYGGAMMDKVNSYSMTFMTQKKVGADEARIIVVDTVSELLGLINANESLRPYLKNYPFTAENIEFLLAFNNRDGKPAEENYIALLFLQDGNICYQKYDSLTKEYNKCLKEKFKDAFEIVKQQRQGKNMACAAPKGNLECAGLPALY